MSQAQAAATGLVRVTVASGTRRVDLMLPGAIPVAELVPELARNVGILDVATVHGGYHLHTADGRRLAGDSGLTLQGVDDGAFLTVTAGVDDASPRVYDDVVEAMTDVVENELTPWAPAAGRRTALGAAVVLLGLGAVALAVQRDHDIAGVAAALVAAALLAGAVVLSRAQREPEVAVTVGWVAAGYAALAGVMLAPAGEPLGSVLSCAGAGLFAVGALGMVGLGPGRLLLAPALVVGAIIALVGLLVQNTDVNGGIVLVVVLSLLILLGSVFPWLALGLTSTNVDQLAVAADITADPDDIDRARVAGDARLAHEILMAISATVGLLLVLVAPIAVGLGVAGTLLAVFGCLVVMLRTRQYRTGSEVIVGLLSGLFGLASVAATILLTREEWRPEAAVTLAGAGALLLVVTMLPSGPSVRRGRLGDVLESLCLLTIVPLLVFATGLIDSITS